MLSHQPHQSLVQRQRRKPQRKLLLQRQQRQQLHRCQLRLFLHQFQEFLDQEIIHSLLVREWEFHVRLLDLAEIILLLLHVMAHLVQADLVRLVPVAHLVQADHVRLVPVAHLALVSEAELRVRAARLQPVADSQLVRAAAQVLVEVAALAAVPLVPLVRAAEKAARPVSQSARNAKSMNRDRRQALVEQLFHAATATP